MPNSSTVLIVEDEPILLMLIEDAFIERGFDVVGAMNSDAALETLSGGAKQIDCLLTDIRLPGDISGWDIAAAARERMPRLPVVYMTGDSMSFHRNRGVPGSKIFGKPADINDIIDTVSELLSE